jgi:hypothetical protein
MNAPQKPASPVSTPAATLIATPWARWQRDLARLGTLLGFRAIGIGLILLLLALLWLDNSQTKRAQQQRAYRSAAAEVSKMRALMALKTKIEQGLHDSLPLYAQAQQQVLTAATPAQAQDQWQAEWYAALQAAQIGNIVITPSPLPAGATPAVVGLELTFSAVPDQLVDLVDKIDHGSRLQRITSLDLTVADDKEQPHLLVHLQLEARYVAPESKGKPTPPAAATPRPAKPTQGVKP